MKKEVNKIFLGKGILGWERTERVSDRYGTVKLFTTTEQNEAVPFDVQLSGRRGALVVEVVKTRESNHIGDLFHGIMPVTPKLGEVFVLGRGTIFFEGIFTVGVKPRGNRATLWLDIKKLYKSHFQTVNLYFE